MPGLLSELRERGRPVVLVCGAIGPLSRYKKARLEYSGSKA